MGSMPSTVIERGEDVPLLQLEALSGHVRVIWANMEMFARCSNTVMESRHWRETHVGLDNR